MEVHKPDSNWSSDVRKSLLAFHAFTGCDYTSAFVRKGKVKPFAKLVKSKEAQRVLAKFTSDESERRHYESGSVIH